MSMVKRGLHGRAFNIPDWMLKLSTLISTPLQSTSELELGIYGNMVDVRLLLSRPLCFLVSKFGKIESKCLKSILMEFFDPADISTAKKQLLEDIISMKLDENLSGETVRIALDLKPTIYLHFLSLLMNLKSWIICLPMSLTIQT